MNEEGGFFPDRHSSDEVPADERCTRCGAALVGIAYGFPGPGMMEAAERGEISLGGCVIFEGQPTHRCSECGATYGERHFRVLEDPFA